MGWQIGMGVGIGDFDLGWEIRIGDWFRGLGLMIGIGHWGLGYGNLIGD